MTTCVRGQEKDVIECGHHDEAKEDTRERASPCCSGGTAGWVTEADDRLQAPFVWELGATDTL